MIETLIYLASCGVNEVVPEQKRVEQADLEGLYRLAKRHSLLALCCMALEKTKAFSNCSEEPVKKWVEEKHKAICKIVMLDAERAELFSYMEKTGIWYMPLKGIILKEYYPQLGMRQMADNDILYDAAYQNQLRTFMESRGYQAKSVGKSNHDVYLKPPVYNFELHTALYGKMHQEGWEAYYRDVKKRLVPDRENGFGFHFRDEDFYVYIISHAYKHFSGSGTGLRTLIDIYVYLKKMEKKLNWQEIENELAALQLSEFEQETRQLCRKVFSMEDEKATSRDNQLIVYYIGSGTYGTMKNRIKKKLQKEQPGEGRITKAAKRRYIRKRLFPDMDYYKQNAPLVYRHKFLIPGFVVYRVLRGLFRNGSRIVSEIRTVNRIK